MDKAEKEERTKVDAARAKEVDTCLAGDLYVKFTDANGKNSIKHGTGHIVKTTDNGFLMVTTRTNLIVLDDDRNE